jgi:hypothetical protein
MGLLILMFMAMVMRMAGGMDMFGSHGDVQLSWISSG